MLKEEAIDLLDTLIGMIEDNHNSDYDTALKMGIQALEQEPAYCDRNICLRNEYNNIGCDECEVTKSQTDAVSKQLLLKLMGEEPLNWTDSDKELQAIEDYRYFKNLVEQLPSVNPQISDQWHELKETITEMRDNDGTGTQQDVCKFLVNYMDVLEKQMQEPKTIQEKGE